MQYTKDARIKALLSYLWPIGLVLFVIVLGTIYAGVCTTTESGALGSVGAFIIAFVIVSLIGTICASFVRSSLISPIDTTDAYQISLASQHTSYHSFPEALNP